MRDYEMTSIVDFAREIIWMAERIEDLEQSLETYKEIHADRCKEERKDLNRSNEFMGNLFIGLLDKSELKTPERTK